MGQVLPFFTRVSPAGGFSGEERVRLSELAERYAAAGVRVEVIYGATEEGDPWCVVKDEAEEVLIHVARIGDTFVVHYALDDALRQGQDLRSVLNERLAWEDRPEVVVPFSRQAQSLLALIVAASFLHETARPDGGPPAALAPEPHDDLAGHAAGAQEPLPPHVEESALAGKAAHGELAGILGLGALSSGHAAEWRALDDAPPIRFDHAAVALARFTPGGPAAPIANLEVAAPQAVGGAAPLLKPFEARPLLAAAVTPEPQQTMSSGPFTASFTVARKPDEEPQKPGAPQGPPTPEHPPVPATHWVEVDTDGDGRPDTRVAVPDEAKSERPELAAEDHAAILAVGHGFPHAEIV